MKEEWQNKGNNQNEMRYAMARSMVQPVVQMRQPRGFDVAACVPVQHMIQAPQQMIQEQPDEMEEIRRLVKEVEETLMELQKNAQKATLNAICESQTFKV